MGSENRKFKDRKHKMAWLKWMQKNIKETIMARTVNWMVVRERFWDI